MKQRLFYIYKFNSSRLDIDNFSIKTDLVKARKNGEVISLADNQMLRTLRQTTEKDIDFTVLDNLIKSRNELRMQPTTKENITKIKDLQKKIDDILLVTEIISVVINNSDDEEDNDINQGHYDKIINRGLRINGKKFVRLMCGAGQQRNNKVYFVIEKYESQLKQILNNDRNEDVELVPAKYNAYFALHSSGTQEIPTPNFIVVPDCVLEQTHKVEFIDDNNIEEKEMKFEKVKVNDGMGLILPTFANELYQHLTGKNKSEFIPSSFIVRAPFLKGLVVSFDFIQYAEEKNNGGNYKVEDVWGDTYDLKDDEIAMIITASQFKLWSSYSSLLDYKSKCIKNNLKWGVVRYDKENSVKDCVLTNYQFLQALNIKDEDIPKLIEPTVSHLKGVLNGDINKVLLYLLGTNLSRYNTLQELLDDIKDDYTKALLLNNNLIHDSYIQKKIKDSLKRKIEQAYIGKIMVEGNYQPMISDPVCLCQSIFKLDVTGLLKVGQHYSNYWNQKGVKKVVAMRAPLTWRSEVNTLNLINNDETEKWYKHIKNGIIYNSFGTDCMLHADSDFDGDIVCTTNNEIILKCTYGGIPITYDPAEPTLTKIIEEELWKYDKDGFNNQVGTITNISTAIYCKLAEFEEDSEEYKELITRLKIIRKLQGTEIDRAKIGGEVTKCPSGWYRYKKINIKNKKETKERKEYSNKISAFKKPYFMKYLYKSQGKKFNTYIKNKETECYIKNRCSIKELENKQEKSVEQIEFLEEYYDFLPLNTTPSSLNKICFQLENELKKEKLTLKKYDNSNEILEILTDSSIGMNDKTYKKILELYKKFKEKKTDNFRYLLENNELNEKNKFDEEEDNGLQQFYQFYKNEAYKICNSARELANYAVKIVYDMNKKDNKDFAWIVAGEGIVQNVLKNRMDKICIPIPNESGNIEYMFKKFKTKEIE